MTALDSQFGEVVGWRLGFDVRQQLDGCLVGPAPQAEYDQPLDGLELRNRLVKYCSA
jgi:hypothetical protein